MKKELIILFVVIVGSILGVVILGSSNDESASTNQDNQPQNITASQENDSGANEEVRVSPTSNEEAKIVAYSEEAVANSDSENKILFFHAAWCSICNQVEKNIEAGTLSDDTTIFKVDYDSDKGQELARKYKIPVQYSMVVVESDGTEIKQWTNTYSTGPSEIAELLDS